ncbi:MAG: hypothetical protein QM490_02120 [Candidatus Gracilibacteria bacterium]
MNILSKIILTTISISVFVFLIFVTYITSNFSGFEKPYYEDLKLGLFDLYKNKDGVFSFSGVSDESEIIVDKINTSDKIIFSSGSIETKTTSGSTIISITQGIYFFDLKEINTHYIIKGQGFEINNKGPGTFVINNLDPKKNIIFSINSVLDLDLKHYNTNSTLTSLDLYPHTYLTFNPIKNIFVKNSDLLRISQIFDIGYFSEKILEDNIVNENFLKIISLRIEKNSKIINESLFLIKQELSEKENIIKKFIKSNFGLIPGEQFINKYFSIFKNPNKKSIYYKNIIIRNLHELLTNDNLNSEIVNLIATNINSIKEVDKEGYNEIIDIINFYYESVIKSNQKNNTKINFSKLINKINNKNTKLSLTSLISLEKIFFEYDFLKNINFYKDISLFRNKYFEDLNVEIDGTSAEKGSVYDIEKVDYLLFFIENILLNDFSSSYDNTNDLITIFSDYVDIANAFYSNSDETIIRTGIFKYSKILNNFINILEDKYFLEERNKSMLLEINEKEKLSTTDILMLEENINKIIKFYNDFTNTLNPNTNNKDKFVIKLYSTLEEKYREYFSALKNYEEYTVKYDKIKKELLETHTINEGGNTLVLSYSHASEYLQKFNRVELRYASITVMDYNYCLSPSLVNSKLPLEVPYCYKIDKLFIDSNNVSFLLFPFDKNKIDEIVVENKAEAGSYKLDEIKALLDEKMKTETKDKDKYDFYNFLANTFGHQVINNNYTNQAVTQTSTTILEEDSVVKIFKRNKLLGELGDFAILEGFIDINYNDLIVEKNGDAYSINVKLGIFNVNLSRNQSFYGEFSSMYNFSPDHSFINPKIKIIDKKSEKDLLLGNYIYITGQYKVNLMEEEIKEVFNHYNEINYMVSNLSQILKKYEIKITYIKDSNKILFETEYNGGKVNLTLDNGNITSFIYYNENRLPQIIPYTELPTILNNIK